MKKSIWWSYSSIKDWHGCPKRYHEVYVLKKHPFIDTPYTIYGKEVHKAAEEYVRDGVDLPEQFSEFKRILNKVALVPGEKFCELELAIDRDFNACEFKSKETWVRGIIDLAIVDPDGDRAIIIDYKTGSAKYPDMDQLELMFLLLHANMPDIKVFDCYLLFLKHGVKVSQSYIADQAKMHWTKWKTLDAELQAAHDAENFPAKKSVLCKYCPVLDCKFNTNKGA